MATKILTVGHACLDIVHLVNEIPKPNTKVASSGVEIRIGGNAANAAAALCELGAEADLCTVLGSDHHPFTRIFVSLLREKGIGTSFCRFEESIQCPCSTIMVLADGERAIVNRQDDAIRSGVSLPDDITRYSMVMADSYRLPMVRSVFLMAHQAGIPTMIDVDGVVDDIGLIPRASHVWFSQEAWRRHRIPLPDLQARFGGVVGVTDGDRPVTWIDTSGKINYHAPPRVNAKNTLGAGDVFRARLGLGICTGQGLTDAVKAACITACEHITNSPISRIT